MLGSFGLRRQLRQGLEAREFFYIGLVVFCANTDPSPYSFLTYPSIVSASYF